MKNLISVLALTMVSTSAMAYREGNYQCKNIAGLPDNTYRIQNVSMGNSGDVVPLVTATRYYRTDVNAPIATTEVKGFAVVTKSKNGEVLILAAIQLVVNGDEIRGCTFIR